MSKHKALDETPHPNPAILELIRYNIEQYQRFDNLPVQDIVQQIHADEVNWINVDGLHDTTILGKLQEHFCLHTLLLEDVVDDQRPKAEEYEDYLFFTLKMLYRIEG